MSKRKNPSSPEATHRTNNTGPIYIKWTVDKRFYFTGTVYPEPGNLFYTDGTQVNQEIEQAEFIKELFGEDEIKKFGELQLLLEVFRSSTRYDFDNNHHQEYIDCISRKLWKQYPDITEIVVNTYYDGMDVDVIETRIHAVERADEVDRIEDLLAGYTQETLKTILEELID